MFRKSLSLNDQVKGEEEDLLHHLSVTGYCSIYVVLLLQLINDVIYVYQ